MPVVSVVGDFDDFEESRRERVLALRGLWRGLECVAPIVVWGQGTGMALSRSELKRDLRELIAALDRRLPAVERAGEIAIAREAAALRASAVARLAQLTTEPASAEARSPAA